ncbi:MAG: MotA/TolQ/ExbB proton channel family protein [Pirellulaceae bacterium]|jgi:biopolymer transport protein ExbB|nr:MotA/TolQ/ExbB proton channel family protein [Pirellulaceae bacterium]
MYRLIFIATSFLVLFAVAAAPRSLAQESSGFEVAAPEAAPAVAPKADNTIVSSRRLLDVIYAGGPLMFPIALCSFGLVVFAFERFFSLRKSRIIPGPFTKKFLEQLKEGQINREAALALCEKNNSCVARVFLAGIQKWGRSGVEVEQAILDAGERVSNELRRYLRLINGISTVTPLLGLLGTVLGMIHAFDAISAVTPDHADPKTLIATGISTALITTAAGMSVAIPALIAYLYFSGVVDRRIMEIDALGMKVVNVISAEAIAGEQHRGTRRTRKEAA